MLYVVATPIGDVHEISQRALQVLQESPLIICESTKEASKLLRAHGISGKQYEVLDEHSKSDDLERLVKLCQEQTVALVSDCGTPGFCDPGADLVRLCRQKGIATKSVLGPSALMGLLSLSGRRLDRFVFRGFLPAENEARRKAWSELKNEKQAIILMDTPYRFKKMMQELGENLPQRQALVVMNLSQETEKLIEGTGQQVARSAPDEKAEFMLLVYPG